MPESNPLQDVLQRLGAITKPQLVDAEAGVCPNDGSGLSAEQVCPKCGYDKTKEVRS